MFSEDSLPEMVFVPNSLSMSRLGGGLRFLVDLRTILVDTVEVRMYWWWKQVTSEYTASVEQGQWYCWMALFGGIGGDWHSGRWRTGGRWQ